MSSLTGTCACWRLASLSMSTRRSSSSLSHLVSKQVTPRATRRRIKSINSYDPNLRPFSCSSGPASCTSTSTTDCTNGVVVVDPRVKAALQEGEENAPTTCGGRPVVALESTIVAHGMPYPENYNLAQKVQNILLANNVLPATIAIQNGVFRVGLSLEELHDLALAGKEGRAIKCSTRELSLLAAKAKQQQQQQQQQQQLSLDPSTQSTSTTAASQWGATTVASTMRLAHLAGISTFVTGGIGGVHRHGECSMDISADLTELAQTPVVVVCAGIKSILDIPRTLEVLETNCVPTVSYQTDEFPAFFSPHSGVKSPARMDTPQEIARAYWVARDLGLSHGMLVAVPNIDPAGANVEEAIQEALVEAEQLHILGRDVTPFILQRVAEKTGGDSLRSNMALVERNAVVGAEIAMAIFEEKQKRRNRQVHSSLVKVPPLMTSPEPSINSNANSPRVVVMGGIVLDIVAKPEPAGRKLILGTSNPASCTESDGGVGRNIAEVLGRLGAAPVLYSAVGNDSRGRALVQRLEEEYGVLHSESTVKIIDHANTASYVAILNGSGDLHTACADMTVLSQIQPPPMDVLQQADALVLDANPPVSILREAARRARQVGTKVYFDPTSVFKAAQATKDIVFLSCVDCAFPNRDELKAMAAECCLHSISVPSSPRDRILALHNLQIINDDASSLEDLATCVLYKLNPSGPAQLVVTLGEEGVLLASRETPCSSLLENVTTTAAAPTVSFQFFPASLPKNVPVVNATGAGDTLCGAYVHAIHFHNKSLVEAVHAGMRAANQSLLSKRTIAENL